MSPRSSASMMFGKVPWAGDFVQSALAPEAEIFRSWLELGIATASERGEGWKTGFDAAAQKAFVFPTGEATVSVGVMKPSRDAVGRRFPLAVFSSLRVESLLVGPHALPLSLGAFLQGADAVLEQLSTSPSSDPTLALSQIQQPNSTELPLHLDAYNGWAQSAALRSAGQAIFGAEWRDRLGHALFVCIESIRPFFGQERPPTPLAVRLPVGAGFAGAVAFWMQVVRTCSGWRTTVPATVWSFEPSGASVTLFFGSPNPGAFADLWETAPRSDNLSNLLVDGYPAKLYLADTRPDLLALLDSPSATVADLIARLGPA
ncbi:MAG TPA: type VI secretion system-associated protein TagF [Polyangiaceae bacterium]|nr:type VI secretion system-associated protein TagF [Polyangiaceae bacterium]